MQLGEIDNNTIKAYSIITNEIKFLPKLQRKFLEKQGKQKSCNDAVDPIITTFSTTGYLFGLLLMKYLLIKNYIWKITAKKSDHLQQNLVEEIESAY